MIPSTHNHSLVLLLFLSQVSCQSVSKRMRKGTCASSPTPFTANRATWKTTIPQRTASPRPRCWSGATRSSPHCFWKVTTTVKTELDTAAKKTSSRQRFSISAWRKEMWCHRLNTTPGVSNVISSTYRGWRRTQSTVTNTVSFHESTAIPVCLRGQWSRGMGLLCQYKHLHCLSS